MRQQTFEAQHAAQWAELRLLYRYRAHWLEQIVALMLAGFPRTLRRHAALLAVSAAAIGLLLWLWSLGGALGPLLPAPERAQCDLMRHLQTGAELLWRHGRSGVQRAAARHRVEAAWLRRHPMLRRLGERGRAHWLARRLGLSPDKVHTALYDERIEKDLVNETRTLQRLWIARRQHARDAGMRPTPMTHP